MRILLIILLVLFSSCQTQEFEVYQEDLNQTVVFDDDNKTSKLSFSFKSVENASYIGELISPSGMIWKFDLSENSGVYSSPDLLISQNALLEVGLYKYNIINDAKVEVSGEVELFKQDFEKQVYSLTLLDPADSLTIKEYKDDKLVTQYPFDINREASEDANIIHVVKSLPHGYVNISINYL